MTDPEDDPLRARHMTSTIQNGDRSEVRSAAARRSICFALIVSCFVLLTPLPALAGLPGREAQKDDMALQWYGDAEDIALLASLLSDADPHVREQAVCNLGQTRNPDALAHVRKALDDTEPAVRRSAVLAAAQLRAPLSEQVVRQALASDDPETVLTAIAAARLQTWRELADALAKCLGHDQARVRVEAQWIFQKLPLEVNLQALGPGLTRDSLCLRRNWRVYRSRWSAFPVERSRFPQVPGRGSTGRHRCRLARACAHLRRFAWWGAVRLYLSGRARPCGGWSAGLPVRARRDSHRFPGHPGLEAVVRCLVAPDWRSASVQIER
ncbi:MAG TPA: HEAT repeat domain-containing protein [Candidatus Hydrogenedentes bacterium]|nr:HEAT repeat domain-containing protein [Candidatus Hydrogenedentota bacterium]